MQNVGRPSPERRRERRIPITHGYTSIHINGEPSPLDGVVSNISDSGACIFTNHKIDQGLHIKIFNKAFGAVPRAASVAWSREVHSGLFMVGLSLA